MKSHTELFRSFSCLLLMLTVCAMQSSAINRISVGSGDWTTSSVWSPSGSPSPTDNITIAPGHTITVSTNQTINQLTVSAGASLTWSTLSTLSVTGNFVVNGTVSMNGGNISLTSPGLQFTLGPGATFTWEPGTNSVNTATLFTNGVESFSPTSTLIIKKWFNYSVPLTSVVTGHFGNLELNSFNGVAIQEWNQQNGFQSHQVLGTLTIDQGWITLDKSGAISYTSIGKIVLKNINSTFYGHHGTHPSLFTLTTGSVVNNGGTFYGLNDGNGNIIFHVTGSFTNYGNVKIINNSGLAGVSNGNATFNVDSTFSQSGGDTRIIYNVSTTNSGLFTANFRNITLTGGVFMAQTGCRTTGGVCALSITENLTIQFQNTTDKFRVSSISSIGNSVNRVQVNLSIGGNLTVSGPLNAEFTSSASAGIEHVTINGASAISGCNVSFNYGAPLASHANTLVMNGQVSITGGIVFLSRNNGASTITLNGNFSISAGQVSVKGGDSLVTMTIAGSYTQTAGQFYIHNNSTTASTQPITLTINGNFSQSSGTLSYDSNPSNASANHSMYIGGSSYTTAGNGSITRAGAGTCASFGYLHFKRTGTQHYYRNSTSSSISQVKQVVNKLCTLKVMNGSFIVSSYSTPVSDLVRVSTGAVLHAGGAQIVSNGSYLYSTILADSNATIITQRPQGFYDAPGSGCMGTGMSFSLNPYSIVEYNGSTNQVLTGNFAGLLPVQNQYGILRINMQSPGLKATMVHSNTVRTRLILQNGEMNLGGNTLTINNGSSMAIIRTGGYINGELLGVNAGVIVWKNMYKGMHEFPFGLSPTAYLPVRFFFMSGNVTDVTASTYATTSNDNLPLPLVNGTSVNFNGLANTYAASNLVDRWWYIDAPGVVAGLTVSYKGTENTMDAGYQSGQVGIVSWTGNSWSAPACIGYGVTAGIGTVSAEIMSDFSAFTVGKQAGLKAKSNIRSFTADLAGDEVLLNWSTSIEYNSDYFGIERSADGQNFEELFQERASGNSLEVLRYSATDPQPLPGTSYYRIRQTSQDGSFNYSSVRQVNRSKKLPLEVESIGPNPFESSFQVQYKTEGEGLVRFEITNSNGKTVYNSEAGDSSGTHSFLYSDGANLQPGLYFLRLTTGDYTVVKKVIKK